jgi:Ca-activated chloride channel family protein
MKLLVGALVAAVSLSSFWRDTNSHASAERGRRAFEKKSYGEAVAGFRRAQELAPSTTGSFNLGTAQIAAGKREEGSATLARALEDPSLTADAYFNRGNSALAAKALDFAIADYVQALKANPSHAGAKRNLEIALARREGEKKSGGAQQRQSPSQPQKQEQKGQAKPRPGQMDLDALLRSVQQQEQEELRRLKAHAGEGRIGW